MMKVFLGDLIHHSFNLKKKGYVVPLNIGYVGSYLKNQLKDQVEVSLFKYPDCFISAFESNPPDIIGFSYYIWNQELSLQFAKKIKEKNPEILIVFGGPNLNDNPSNLIDFFKSHPYVDYYIPFEGEKPFANLVQAFIECNKDITKLKNRDIEGAATYLEELKYTPTSTKTGILDYPSPYLSGVLDKFLKDPHFYPLFETNRGCPFTCTYCCWGSKARNKMTLFPMDQVFAEFEYAAKNGVNYERWILADSNFGMFERDIKIAEKIKEISQKYGVKSITAWNSKNTTDRNIVIAETLGHTNGFLIAFQTLDPEVLVNIKRHNIQIKSLERLMEHFKTKDAEIETDILCGLPGETFEKHLETLRKCLNYKINWIRTMDIILLPASDLASKESVEKFGIKTKFRLNLGSSGKYWDDWVIDTEKIIVSTNALSEEELLQLRFIRFCVWLFWNNKILHPLFLAGLSAGINPIDIILNTIKAGDKVFQGFDMFVKNYLKDAKEELFNTKNELIEYYTSQEDVQKKLDEFIYINFVYTAKILLNKEYLKGITNYILQQIQLRAGQSSLDFKEIKDFCLNRLWLDMNDFPREAKSFELSNATFDFLKQNGVFKKLEITNGNKTQFKLRLKSPDFIAREIKLAEGNLERAIRGKAFLKNLVYSEIQTNVIDC